ncbi:hypothetical protein C0J52_04651, partial [Blattella germanica]
IFAIFIEIEKWNIELRAYVIETFFLNNDSVTLTQRRFRLHSNVGRYGRVPSRNTILLWVKNFRTSDMALKNKPPGDVRTIRTPRNIQALRQVVQNSPTPSYKTRNCNRHFRSKCAENIET